MRTLCVAWLLISALFVLSRSLPQPEINLEEFRNTASADEQEQARLRYRQRLGVDLPVFYCRLAPWQWHGSANQYHRWLRELSRGSLGTSYRDGRPALDHITEALAVTLPLTSLAFVGAGTVALAISLLMSRRAQARIRTVLVPALYGLDALPLVLIGLLLLLLFANPDALALFPAYGMDYADDTSASAWWQQVPYLVLPGLSLVLVSLPALVLPLDAALQETQDRGYTATARAKGLGNWQVLARHRLPNALGPFITGLTDLLPGLVAGAAVVEVLYALPGMGLLLVKSSAARDYPVLLAITCLIAAARLGAWLLADVLMAVIDPRTVRADAQPPLP